MHGEVAEQPSQDCRSCVRAHRRAGLRSLGHPTVREFGGGLGSAESALMVDDNHAGHRGRKAFLESCAAALAALRALIPRATQSEAYLASRVR